jgi:hypothetical protein
VNELIKKMSHTHTEKFHSATKKNEIISFTGKWTKRRSLKQNKPVSQRHVSCFFAYV